MRGVTIDGRTRQFELDTVTLPAVFRDLFRKSGRPLESVLELKMTTGRRHVFKDKSVLDLPLGNRGDQHAALIEAFGEDEWSPWIDGLADTWDVIRRTALDQVFAGQAGDRPARPQGARAAAIDRVRRRPAARRATRQDACSTRSGWPARTAS